MPLIIGNNQPNVLEATAETDRIFGRGGNDSLSSDFGAAELHGESGNDFLGIDYLFDGLIADLPVTLAWQLYGEDGDDRIVTDIDITGSYSDDQANYPDPSILANGGNGDDDIDIGINFDLGGGDLVTARVDVSVRDLAGDNTVSIDTRVIANNAPASVNGNVLLGGGDDIVTIRGFAFGLFFGPGILTYDINLGSGNNTLQQGQIFGELRATVRSGSGNDTIEMSVIRADLGAGDDSFTGTGTINLGSGEDSMTVSGRSTVTTGLGADTVLADKSALVQQTEIGPPGEGEFDYLALPLTITDLNFAEGDKLVLTGFDLPQTGGVIDDIGDLLALTQGDGDVLGLALRGNDLVLTLDTGFTDQSGQPVRSTVIFHNLDLPAPSDPAESLLGTVADDTFIGGDNGDTFRLRLGNDTATGGASGDSFGFSARGQDNNDGDTHVITDLNFFNGDELRFRGFGADWAVNQFGSSFLTYRAATDTWIADNPDDIAFLRDIGAVETASIETGTRITYLDAGGDSINVDLEGLLLA